ncbi:hypothetical protein ACHAWO_003553 [Cyclotella atomus]|uniref:glutamate decarboxylase n=1 Tax=Cyclotella atomus TaxID=382360 RepID=A0ABD3QSQ8_9STRA
MSSNPIDSAIDKDALIASLVEETRRLQATVSNLEEKIRLGESFDTTFAASKYSSDGEGAYGEIPQTGMPAKHVVSLMCHLQMRRVPLGNTKHIFHLICTQARIIDNVHLCDFNPLLNTSSYVNVTAEDEEKAVALMGSQINIADASVYPASIELHNKTVNMIANLWHAPKPAHGHNYTGAGTVGSTEACLLAGLAHKFRWRKWYAEKHGLTDNEVLAVRPNLVISSAYQAAWEKLFRYFDIEPKIVKPDLINDKMVINAHELVAQVDEKTIAVVGILGNHYNGAYDPIWDINDELEVLNAQKGWQVGIHVDAASGGFIAPFQELSGKGTPRPFDFRLPNVLSISSSGHKFGESICGTGWIVFRQREDLAEHIAVTVTYLGGSSDSLTLNFSRPASGPYVQFFKLLRLGKEGYMKKVENQMSVAAYLRNFIASLTHPSGHKRFQILDGGDTCCLPVVSARLNPDLGLHYDDKDFQHALSESHWYVSGYSLGFENPATFEFEDLFTDVDQASTMFRIVVKSNLSMGLAQNLANKIKETLLVLDSLDEGYESVKQRMLMLQAKAKVLDELPKIKGPKDKRLKALAKTVIFKKHMERKSAERSNISGYFVSQHTC